MRSWRGVAAMAVLAVMLAPAGGSALTPPVEGLGVAAPAGLTLRVPWRDGESHELGDWRYSQLGPDGAVIGGSDHRCTEGGSQDCYALDVVGLTTDTEILPLFPGTVVYSGCAYGGASDTWRNYGQVVYIETVVDGAVHGAFYAHLSDRLVATDDVVAADQPIGHAGSTGRHLDGTVDCYTNDPAGNVHLHFAVYRHEQPGIHPASWWDGGPHGGTAVVPEPLVGVEAYEDLATRTGSLVAGEAGAEASDPCTGGASPPEPTPVPDPVPILSGQWILPVECATVGSRPTLTAWPSVRPEDAGRIAVTRVTFHAAWPGGEATLCSATRAGDDGTWSCRANLVRAGVPFGPVELTFDVFDDAADVAHAADGVTHVQHAIAGADAQTYLLAGIPAGIRATCEKRTDNLVPGTIAALNCYPTSRRIEEMAYYLMRPADALSTFDERMGQYGLRKGGDCAAGIAGIESRKPALASGCYRDGEGRANLRFAASVACPSAYWAVLSTKGDIARLADAYDSVVGGPWSDPGLAGAEDAPGCSGPLPAVAPPGAPAWASITRYDDPYPKAIQRACAAAGFDYNPRQGMQGEGGCSAFRLSWGTSAGRVDRYMFQDAPACWVDRYMQAPYKVKRPVQTIRSFAATTHAYDWITVIQGVDPCEHHYRLVAVNDKGSSDPVSIHW